MATQAPGHEPQAPDDGAAGHAADEALIRRISAGDGAAFRALVEEHLDAIHAYLYRMTGSRTEAEDLAQETFLRVWRRASTFDANRVQLTTWLHTIAHNLCIDSFRRSRPMYAYDEALEADGTADPERQASGRQLAELVEQLIASLPDNQRSAILLCQVQGFSNAEAARILGVNLRALESLLARARRTLREAVAGRTGDPRR